MDPRNNKVAKNGSAVLSRSKGVADAGGAFVACKHKRTEDTSCAARCVQVTDLYDPRTQWASYLLNAIKAKELHKKDIHYIVKDGEVGLQALWDSLSKVSIRAGKSGQGFDRLPECVMLWLDMHHSKHVVKLLQVSGLICQRITANKAGAAWRYKLHLLSCAAHS